MKNRFIKDMKIKALGLAMAIGYVGGAMAQLPTGGAFTMGSGSIDESIVDVMTVTGNARANVIEWDSFNIGAGQTVNFENGFGNGTTIGILNQVTGASMTEVLGTMNIGEAVHALIQNPNGISFGTGSEVNISSNSGLNLISGGDYNDLNLDLTYQLGRLMTKSNASSYLSSANPLLANSITINGAAINSIDDNSLIHLLGDNTSLVNTNAKIGALVIGELSVSNSMNLTFDNTSIEAGYMRAKGADLNIINNSSLTLGNQSVLAQPDTLNFNGDITINNSSINYESDSSARNNFLIGGVNALSLNIRNSEITTIGAGGTGGSLSLQTNEKDQVFSNPGLDDSTSIYASIGDESIVFLDNKVKIDQPVMPIEPETGFTFDEGEWVLDSELWTYTWLTYPAMPEAPIEPEAGFNFNQGEWVLDNPVYNTTTSQWENVYTWLSYPLPNEPIEPEIGFEFGDGEWVFNDILWDYEWLVYPEKPLAPVTQPTDSGEWVFIGKYDSELGDWVISPWFTPDGVVDGVYAWYELEQFIVDGVLISENDVNWLYGDVMVDGVSQYTEYGFRYDGVDYLYENGEFSNVDGFLTWIENVTDPVVTNPVVTNPVVTNPVVTNPVVTGQGRYMGRDDEDKGFVLIDFDTDGKVVNRLSIQDGDTQFKSASVQMPQAITINDVPVLEKLEVLPSTEVIEVQIESNDDTLALKD